MMRIPAVARPAFALSRARRRTTPQDARSNAFTGAVHVLPRVTSVGCGGRARRNAAVRSLAARASIAFARGGDVINTRKFANTIFVE